MSTYPQARVRTLAIAIALLAPSIGSAQVSISPYAGAMLYDGSLMLFENGVYRGSGLDLDGTVPVVGVRAGYRIAAHWNVEVSYGRSWLDNARGDVASHLVHGTLGYVLSPGGAWSGHLAAGLGGIGYRPSAADLNDLSDPLVAGGGGLAYRVGERVQLRADLRFYGQFCGHADDRDGFVCNDGSQLGYTELAGGVNVQF